MKKIHYVILDCMFPRVGEHLDDLQIAEKQAFYFLLDEMARCVY